MINENKLSNACELMRAEWVSDGVLLTTSKKKNEQKQKGTDYSHDNHRNEDRHLAPRHAAEAAEGPTHVGFDAFGQAEIEQQCHHSQQSLRYLLHPRDSNLRITLALRHVTHMTLGGRAAIVAACDSVC